MAVILSVDAGTSSVRVAAVNDAGIIVRSAQQETSIDVRGSDLAEQDPEQVWQAVTRCLISVINALEGEVIAGIGVTNQRESFVLIDPRTDEPLTPIVLWLDRRSGAECERLRTLGLENQVRATTGLFIDPYFTATKARLVLEELRSGSDYTGPVLLATVDSWIINRLCSGGWVTDPSNASRTLLLDIDKMEYSDSMLETFGLSNVSLAELHTSFAKVGTADAALHGALRGVAVAGILGDQQASLLGQGCTTKGLAKNTYGTGAFLLVNAGEVRPEPLNGLLTSIAWAKPDGSPTYVLEGSIYSCGSILRWMRDDLKLFDDFGEVEAIASSVADSAGVTVVPAFEGLGSPWLEPTVRASITGLSQSTTKPHLIRAAIEAMAFQTQDVVVAIESSLAEPMVELRVDGGAAVMNLLCQFQADQLGMPVTRSSSVECTTLGAAFAAGIGVGFWSDLAEVSSLYRRDTTFAPTKSKAGPRTRYERWSRSLTKARSAG